MLLFGAVTPLTDVWTSETREKQVKETKKKNKHFFFRFKDILPRRSTTFWAACYQGK